MSRVLTILIADDDKDDHFFLEQALREISTLEYNLHHVYNGRELMDYFSSGQPHPDLLILDLNMPILDGFGVLMKIKSSEKLRKIPVFILTTSNKEADRERCKELGCAEFYTKPYSVREFSAIIEDIFFKLVTP